MNFIHLDFEGEYSILSAMLHDTDNNTERSSASRVQPVFVRNNTLPAFSDKEYSTSEICTAVEKVCGFGNAIGAQRIGGLWRIYLSSETARQKLLISGVVLRGVQVLVRDKNPFIVISQDGSQTEQQTTRLSIGNIPLSFSDKDILESMKALKCQPQSKMVAERDRDANGKLTRWLTGRRFIYIATPPTPLPKSVKIGPFTASLYHKEQKDRDRQRQAECSRCLQNTHPTAQCLNPIKCKQCYRDGHKAGDPQCHLFPDSLTSAEDFPPPPPPLTGNAISPSPAATEALSQFSSAGRSLSSPPQGAATRSRPTEKGNEAARKSPSPSPVRGRSRSKKQNATGLSQQAGLKQTSLHFSRRDSSSAKRARSPLQREPDQRDKLARISTQQNTTLTATDKAVSNTERDSSIASNDPP